MFEDATREPDSRCPPETSPGLTAEDLMAASRGLPDEHGLAGVSRLEGCAELASWVASVDPTVVNEFDLVELIAAFERVAAWAKGRAAAAAAEVAARPWMNPGKAPQMSVTVPCAAGTELSLRLGVSPYAATRLVATGEALAGALQATGAALDSGAIDWGKATVIVDGLKDVPWQVAHLVEVEVLPLAPSRTHSQLRRDVARALAEVDPRDAQERHARAIQSRRVEHPRILPDGMASVRAVLPADAAVRLDATLHSAARTAKAAGDTRTVDQLRADALDAMATTAWETGWIGPCPGADATVAAPSSVRVGRVGGRRTQVRVTVGYGTLIGLDERPAELEGYGPIGADVARRIAAEGTWRRLLVDPFFGAVLDVGRTRYQPPPDLIEHVVARNPHCLIPTCSVPASSCDIDHTVPFGAHGPTAAHNNGPACRHHHVEKTHGGLTVTQPRPGHFHIRTLTGHHYDEAPTRPPGVPAPDEDAARRSSDRRSSDRRSSGGQSSGGRSSDRGPGGPRPPGDPPADQPPSADGALGPPPF